MSSKVNLLKQKQITELQAQLEIEMAKNAKVSDGTLPISIGKKKTIVKRTASKVIKRAKVIGNIEKPKANRVIKTPKEVKVDDRRKRYVNLITLNYVLRQTYLAALRKIKKKGEKLQRKFEEISQKIEKNINDQQPWFPLKCLCIEFLIIFLLANMIDFFQYDEQHFLLYICELVYYTYHHNDRQPYNHIHHLYPSDMIQYMIYHYLVYIHIPFH